MENVHEFGDFVPFAGMVVRIRVFQPGVLNLKKPIVCGRGRYFACSVIGCSRTDIGDMRFFSKENS